MGSNPSPKVLLPLGKSSPKGEKIRYPPGLPPCQISSPCFNHAGDIAYKNLADKQTQKQ